MQKLAGATAGDDLRSSSSSWRNQKPTLPYREHGNGNPPFPIGTASSNCGCSVAKVSWPEWRSIRLPSPCAIPRANSHVREKVFQFAKLHMALGPRRLFQPSRRSNAPLQTSEGRGLKPLQPGYVDHTNIKTWMCWWKAEATCSMSNQTSCHQKCQKKHHWTWQKLLNTKSPLSLSLCVAGNGTPVFEVGTPWRYKDFRHPGSWALQKLLHILLETRIPQNLRPLLLKHGNSIYLGPSNITGEQAPKNGLCDAHRVTTKTIAVPILASRRCKVMMSWKVSLGEKNKKGSLPVRRRQQKHVLIWKWSSWNTCNRNMKHQPPRLSCCVLDATRQSSSQDVEIILTKHW